MGREPLLGEEYSPAPLLSGSARERRQRPLHYGLYAASLVTLCAALYLFIEGLMLLNQADAQSSWRPGSNLWGSVLSCSFSNKSALPVILGSHEKSFPLPFDNTRLWRPSASCSCGRAFWA